MTTEIKTTSQSSELNLFQSLFASQPRGVRVFTPELEILWDNCTERDQQYPLFRDAQNQVIEFPTEENALRMWPVHQVRLGFPRSERNYITKPASEENPICFRVLSWPMNHPETGQRLIVEETERLPNNDRRDCVEHLDKELETLLHDVVEYLERGPNGHVPRLRLSNPNLQPCEDVKECNRRGCPAYDNKVNRRCWEIAGTTCPDMNNQDALTKFEYCSECEVFMMACPDPLTHMAENLNRLISLLQMKFQESLQAQMQLQQADKLAVLGELLAGIAHEIKNPLGIIMGRIDCLTLEMDSLSPDELGEDLSVIHEQTHRVRKIIDHLLEMAGPNASDKQEANVHDVIHDTLPMVRKALKDGDIRLYLKIDNDLPPIQADPIQLQQILINLILNARDAMPEGGSLTIAAKTVGDDPKELQVSVLDTGTGMTQKEMSQIFSAFYTTKKDKGGTGLGLSVCQRIMRQHGGRITVESAPKKGTVMRLWFPAGRVLK